MPMPPVPGFYAIFVKGNPSFCLGRDGTTYTLAMQTYDPLDKSLLWGVWPIHGSNGFFLQHLETTVCTTFSYSDHIGLTYLEPGNPDYVMMVDDVGEGYCAINNHNRSLVFDVQSSNYANGTLVVPYRWNGADNQKWQFVRTSAF